jgi:hypothetical protein
MATLAVAAIICLSACYDNMVPTDTFHPYCDSSSIGDDIFCQTDNRQLTFHRQAGFTSAEYQHMSDTLYGSYDTTVLNVTYHSTPIYDGPDETDIIFQKASVPSGLVGITWCENAATWVKCDQHYVRFKSGYSVSRALACHESGHAVGLTHGSDAAPKQSDRAPSLECLRNPIQYATESLGSHNKDAVDATY